MAATMFNDRYVVSTSSGLMIVNNYGYGYSQYRWERPKETRKEKHDRISKELMKASWSLFNQIAMAIVQIIQICKPYNLKKYAYG